MLCGACQYLLTTTPKSPAGSWSGSQPQLFGHPQLEQGWAGAHHVEPGSFVSAAENACYICSTIFRDCNTQLRQRVPFFRTFYQLRLDKNNKTSEARYELEFTVEVLPEQKPLVQGQVFSCNGTFKILPQNDIPDYGKPLTVTGDTFSGEVTEQIRRWLNNCTAVHKKCQLPQQKSRKCPARLLYVAQANQVSLKTFGENAAHPQYVTMSHCWDAGMPIKLTKSTEDALTKGLSTSELPQRFQDAITVARWMEIDYIWIDAFCIMQDSNEDRLMQSAIMGNIYTNSYCNLAATSAEPTKGCFTNRNTSITEPYPVPDPQSSNSAPTYRLGYDDFWSNSLLDTHLNNRAWGLQERLLCPRTIHFGQEQIFWECRSEMACETYPSGIPTQFRNWRTAHWRLPDQLLAPEPNFSIVRTLQPRVLWQRISVQMMKLLGMVDSKLTTRQRIKIHETWSKTIEQYMACKLSVSSDKLVAISGIATKVAEITNERYLAGLWDNSMLPQSLLWYVVRRRQADGSPSVRSASQGDPDYRAPSWSWASLESKLAWNWPRRCHKILIQISKTVVETAPGREMGMVSSATMEIKGNLFEARLQVMTKRQDGELEEDGRYVLQLRNDIRQRSASDAPAPPITEPMIYLDTPFVPEFSEIGIYLLPICTEWKGRSGGGSVRVAGLLLKKAPSSKTQVQYERIGIFGFDQTRAEILCGIPFGDIGDIESHLSVARPDSVILI